LLNTFFRKIKGIDTSLDQGENSKYGNDPRSYASTSETLHHGQLLDKNHELERKRLDNQVLPRASFDINRQKYYQEDGLKLPEKGELSIHPSTKVMHVKEDKENFDPSMVLSRPLNKQKHILEELPEKNIEV